MWLQNIKNKYMCIDLDTYSMRNFLFVKYWIILHLYLNRSSHVIKLWEKLLRKKYNISPLWSRNIKYLKSVLEEMTVTFVQSSLTMLWNIRPLIMPGPNPPCSPAPSPPGAPHHLFPLPPAAYDGMSKTLRQWPRSQNTWAPHGDHPPNPPEDVLRYFALRSLLCGT